MMFSEINKTSGELSGVLVELASQYLYPHAWDDLDSELYRRLYRESNEVLERQLAERIGNTIARGVPK